MLRLSICLAAKLDEMTYVCYVNTYLYFIVWELIHVYGIIQIFCSGRVYSEYPLMLEIQPSLHLILKVILGISDDLVYFI